MRTLAIVLLIGISQTGALAQQPAAKSEETAVLTQRYGDTDKTCLEWNDGCRTCRRPEAGETACSNIGIACQPTAVTCTRRTEPAK